VKAWFLRRICNLGDTDRPLELSEAAVRSPEDEEILIRVSCCGVCHTELDEIEGRTPPANFPVIPGHQVIGVVEKCGNAVTRFRPDDRVGAAWIFSACGKCEYCLQGLENLCPHFQATGRDHNGGYAQFMTVGERFAYPIPPAFSDAEAAPLLCAGAIGYRSLKLAGIRDGQTLGLTGFGASGHLVLKMARHLYPASSIYVFARSEEEQDFARHLGANWAGNFPTTAPGKANAIIDTTPAWSPVLESLLQLAPGGRLVINAIRKESRDASALSLLRYQDHLWMEKEIKSVANITRADVDEFLTLAASIPIKPDVEIYPFEDANRALLDLKHKHVKGAKVLIMTNKE
jgi:propanol-preferring alcohol dehydrogenase